MKALKIRGISLFLILITVFSLLFSVGVSAQTEVETASILKNTSENADTGTVLSTRDNIKVSSRLYELFFGKDKKEELCLIPGGDVFGIRIKEEFVTVSGAGSGSALKRGDKIVSINGEKISEISDVNNALAGCHGAPLKIEILRSGEKVTLTVMPKRDGNDYKLGVTLRKTASGIGTVTFIDPETQVFGGLGHGICESDSGRLVGLESGEVSGVVLGGVTRGEAGKPGELSGVLGRKTLGSIYKNHECGVFGVLDDMGAYDSTPMPVANKSEIKLGEAEIISTVKNGKKASYKIEIVDIDKSSTGSKSFRIKVTDPMLITLTGGIVRGMSGSPIIQNGKLVGAVTHVLVAEPTEGYGIFIENMLNASESARNELPRAA